MEGLKQKLNPQAERIYILLLDYAWHCPIDWNWSDGHGKRLTDINRYLKPKGNKLDWDWCDCGRHTAQIKKRRIIPFDQPFTHEPTQNSTPRQEIKPLADLSPVAQQFLQKFCQPKEKVNTLF